MADELLKHLTLLPLQGLSLLQWQVPLCPLYSTMPSHFQLMTGSLGKEIKKKKEQKPQALISSTLTQPTIYSQNSLYLTLTDFLKAQKRWGSVNPLINVLYPVSSTFAF